MATQIKVIKCPQCGSTTPVAQGNNHYKCDKCGTEFFLDSDDVNVNVNYRYDSAPANSRPSQPALPKKIIPVFVVVFILLIFTSIIASILFKNITRTPELQAVGEKNAVQYSKCLFSIPLSANNQGVAFYLINKKSNNSYAVFQDIATGKIISEQKVGVNIFDSRKIAFRYFRSDSVHYVIINDKFIYKIDPAGYAFTDITSDICARKPALKAGLMSVKFVSDDRGEGFCVNTNLGKELYYFPKTDLLCTEKAFEVMSQADYKLPAEAKNCVYYLFLNKESLQSSNVAQLYEVTYKFNNGGPEYKLMRLSPGEMNDLSRRRIVSCKPITEERIYFSPDILYFDSRNILIVFRPTLAPDAPYNVQLLDTAGKIIWTVSFKDKIKNIRTVRTNQGFVIQTSENEFYEINNDGANKQYYKLSYISN